MFKKSFVKTRITKGCELMAEVVKKETRIHKLKLRPEYYEAIKSGVKRFEVRINDRDYRVGDIIEFNEFDRTKGYTGRTSILFTITYILSDFDGLKDGYVILNIRPTIVDTMANLLEGSL